MHTDRLQRPLAASVAGNGHHLLRCEMQRCSRELPAQSIKGLDGRPLAVLRNGRDLRGAQSQGGRCQCGRHG
ncbi:hypothetical protein A3768_1956 [Ralstonia solanacearum]|nr:hypothetical protein A3768_1956 [Ralstonia solanacearum]